MLACSELSVRVGGRPLLSEVELQIDSGEVVAVLGENGAGKSTLARVLAGDSFPLRTRVTGRAWLNGRNVREWSPLERARQRAVLPQQAEVAFAFTALELAALGRFAHGGTSAQATTIARAALRLSDAAHLEARDITTLSGGERARVHLAAVFAQLWETEAERARYLLLDEPTASLDLAHQHDLLATVRRFSFERGLGVLMILHDLNLAAQYADRVLVLLNGRVLASGTPPDVLQPQTIADGFAVAAQVLANPLTRTPLVATAARGTARA